VLVSLGPVLALVSQSHLEGTILPRGFFLGLGLIYLLALGLDRLCQRLRLPGAVAILLFGLLLQFVLGRYVAISAVHVESIHRVSLALLIFVAGLGTNLRLIRGGLATAASLCLLLPLLMWFCLSAGFLGVGVPLAAAALAGCCLLANDSAALEDLLEAAGRPIAGRLRHLMQFESALSTLVALLAFAFVLAHSLVGDGAPELQPARLQDLPAELGGLGQQLAAGLAAGSGVGALAPRLANRLIRADRQLLLLAIGFAFVAYGLGQQLGGGGLIAVFIAGVWIANGSARPQRNTPHAWQQALQPFNTAAELTLVLLLGLLVEPQALVEVWPAALLISAILSLARLLGVPLLLGIGSALPLKDRRLVAAAGVPGAVAIALAVSLVDALPHLGSLSTDTAEILGRQLLAIIFLVVLLSQWLRSLWLRRALDHEPGTSSTRATPAAQHRSCSASADAGG
jgi:cell volume regulation protein A